MRKHNPSQIWEYSSGGRKNLVAFYRLVELARSGQLLPTDLVRKQKGLWVQAQMVGELSALFKNSQ